MREKTLSAPAKTTVVLGSEWYRKYYAEKGAEQNSLLRNPEVLYHSLAWELTLARGMVEKTSKGGGRWRLLNKES